MNIIYFLIILFIIYYILYNKIEFFKKKRKNKKKNRIITYTIVGKNDGFGAQYHAIISGIVYCKYMKYKYIHTPFQKMGHNSNIKSLNKFIGIPVKSYNKNINIKKQYEGIVHFSDKPSIYYTPVALKLIRKYYYSTPKPIIDNIDIAIHIRRGDVNSSITSRYTDNTQYIKYINYLLKKYPSYKIKIFSQGNITDFKELQNERVFFYLNKSVEETFHSLVIAKVLLTAKSSFSYSAALLNKNTIYYINFWHKPLDHWYKIETIL